MNKTAIFYGSSTGNTESVAKQLAKMLQADTYDVADNPINKIAEYQNLIFGTSTWGIGDLQNDWDSFLPRLVNADLNNKVVALFGLGDGTCYADSFIDGMGAIYNTIKNKGCRIVGFVATDGYDYESSIAETDGKFVGLPIDEDNESDITEERINNWIEQLKEEFNL
ncbi:MAG: flavodoxin [Bacteroidales bacterium]|nr:flavodoxin [Bacteroidales bacterium]